MTLRTGKISVAEYDRLIEQLKEAHVEYKTAKAEVAKASKCEIMQNCPNCNGYGSVKLFASQNPHLNPTGHLIYGDCPVCKGKGYV